MAKAKAPTRKKQTLARRFKCPFCANDDVVECKMDLGKGVGSLACRICSASYQMPIHHLHEAIDVFSEWLDDCEAAERGEVAAASAHPNNGRGEDMSKAVHDTGGEYDDDEESLPEASGLGQKRPGTSSGGGEDGERRKGVASSDLGLDDSEEESE